MGFGVQSILLSFSLRPEISKNIQKSIYLFLCMWLKEDLANQAYEAKTISVNQISCLFWGKWTARWTDMSHK